MSLWKRSACAATSTVLSMKVKLTTTIDTKGMNDARDPTKVSGSWMKVLAFVTMIVTMKRAGQSALLLDVVSTVVVHGLELIQDQ